MLDHLPTIRDWLISTERLIKRHETKDGMVPVEFPLTGLKLAIENLNYQMQRFYDDKNSKTTS